MRGVYALLHRERGLAYVGSSTNLVKRQRVWAGRFELIGLGGRPQGVTEHFMKLAAGVDAAGWQFVVLLEFADDVEAEAMQRFEFAYMRCFYRLSAGSCLNVRSALLGNVEGTFMDRYRTADAFGARRASRTWKRSVFDRRS